jgi:hypothetical protein
MKKIAAYGFFTLLFATLAAAGTDPRAVLFCDLAAKDFAAYLPALPVKHLSNRMCTLGSLEAGEVDVDFPTLGTDSLQRERIVTVALGGKPIDEPGLGRHAFSTRRTLPDPHLKSVYSLHYYAGKNAQILGFEFLRVRPFTAADHSATRAAIKAFLDELD